MRTFPIHHTRTLVSALAVGLAAGLAACGSDDSGPAPGASGTGGGVDAGPEASAGSGGHAGAAGKAGSGGTAGSAGKAGNAGNAGAAGAPPECTSKGDCTGGKDCCSGSCIDTQTDKAHCGSCDNDCGNPANTSGNECSAGKCEMTCAGGRADCDLLSSNGCEIDLATDAVHCGACATLCLFANATPSCQDSKCAIASCDSGFDNCDSDAANGCEAVLATDPANCGACGQPCTPAAHTQPTCAAGQCAYGPCEPGWTDCDKDPSNGCEVSTATDPVNCGSCGFVCSAPAHAPAACVSGACTLGTCDNGFADCDQSVWNGCEAELASDTKNCNTCGNACPSIDHGMASCSVGACGIAACDPGFYDCDNDASNGCEVNLANDGNNCGACGFACPPVPNGNPVCTGFQCGIGSCVAPFEDCYSGAVDGCETNLKTAVDHCGTCATVCPVVANGSRACSDGQCGIGQCAASFKDCNNSAADGCEADVTTDPNNCGTCGYVCPTPTNGVAGCAAGQCVLASCNAGFSDCSSTEEGCEASTASSAANCGGCGVVCGSGTCVDSKCQCNKNVLMLVDDSPTAGLTPLLNALVAAGYTVNSTTKSYQYSGTPALTGTAFGAVIVLAGTSGAAATTDMPTAGQTAIKDFVLTLGNGAILTEWAALHVLNDRWQTLKPLVLLNRTGAFTGPVTYTVDAAFAGHPLWGGLPGATCSLNTDCAILGSTCATGHCSGTFNFNSSTNIGITNIATGVVRVAGSPQAIDGVALMALPKGRAVHVSHAGNYNTSNGWSSAAMQRLMVNAVGWAARCK